MKPKLITTLSGYTRADLQADVLAGISVALVALPLSLAIAIASGASPASGLMTAIVGGFLISFFGGSRVQIGGPTGAFIVVVHGVIASHGYDGLVLATFMAGMILVGAGVLRMGSLIRLIPEAVIHGFTIGIAIIIAASQIKDLFGLRMDAVPAEFAEKVAALWQHAASWNGSATAAGFVTMALIIAFRRYLPRFPGLVFAATITSLGIALAGLPVETIQSRFGALPSTLPFPELPQISYGRVVELLPSAMLIAFLAGVESLLSAIVADRLIGSRHRSNAELTAQGIANIGSALFGGLPATGAIARTATNVRAGARTPVAGLVHAAVILLILFVAAPLAGYLAMPVMAGILMLTAWNMAEPGRWRHYAQLPRPELGLLLLTLVLTVVVDLAVAIGVGASLGLALQAGKGPAKDKDWTPPER